ncbi:MAG: hypothetical protein ACYS9X_01550 [Planctomycetota bacterium]|jgi:hypothetical protein
MALSWLRRHWLDAISDWRKAPVCFTLGGLFFAGMFLSVALFICGGSWTWYYIAGPVVDPIMEYFYPGIDAPDSWALGITYWLYFTMGLCCGSLAFLWAGVWRAYRRDAAGREGPPPDVAAGQV